MSGYAISKPRSISDPHVCETAYPAVSKCAKASLNKQTGGPGVKYINPDVEYIKKFQAGSVRARRVTKAFWGTLLTPLIPRSQPSRRFCKRRAARDVEEAAGARHSPWRLPLARVGARETVQAYGDFAIRH